MTMTLGWTYIWLIITDLVCPESTIYLDCDPSSLFCCPKTCSWCTSRNGWSCLSSSWSMTLSPLHYYTMNIPCLIPNSLWCIKWLTIVFMNILLTYLFSYNTFNISTILINSCFLNLKNSPLSISMPTCPSSSFFSYFVTFWPQFCNNLIVNDDNVVFCYYYSFLTGFVLLN